MIAKPPADLAPSAGNGNADSDSDSSSNDDLDFHDAVAGSSLQDGQQNTFATPTEKADTDMSSQGWSHEPQQARSKKTARAHSAGPNLRDLPLPSLIFSAADRRDWGELDRLLRMDGADPNIMVEQCDMVGLTHEVSALIRASLGGASYAPIVRLLLEHGAKPDLIDASSYTPLRAAASVGGVQTIELLFKHGASRSGVLADMAFGTACYEKQLRSVEALVRFGCETSECDEYLEAHNPVMQCLQAVAHREPYFGFVVRVNGLVSATEHNGLEATVVAYIKAKDRFEVRLFGGKGINIQAKNISIIAVRVGAEVAVVEPGAGRDGGFINPEKQLGKVIKHIRVEEKVNGVIQVRDKPSPPQYSLRLNGAEVIVDPQNMRLIKSMRL
jgi:hypothetical protein